MNYAISYIRNKHNGYADNLDIMVPWSSRRVIPKMLKDNPNTRFILLLEEEEITTEDEKIFQSCADYAPRFLISVSHPGRVSAIRNLNIPFFISLAVNTYPLASYFIELGCCELVVTSPLTFDLKNLKSLAERVPLRMNPIYHDFGPADAIKTEFVRPEDVGLYEGIISTFEFYNCGNNIRQKALVDTYENGYFAGNLDQLMPGMPKNIPNPLLIDDFGPRRANCNMRCFINSQCDLCNTVLKLIPAAKKIYELKYGL